VVDDTEIELALDEIRAVARFAARCAQDVLPLFEDVHPDDPRPRAALEAAWAFADGDPRSLRQRTTAVAAHRAAREATDLAASHAARSAGDAAAAAYLHPLHRATQVGHLLGAAANAARAVELRAGDDPDAGEEHLAHVARHASPAVVDVLRRYPPAPAGRTRVARLMTTLDAALRASRP
jgi:hypothetical protein